MNIFYKIILLFLFVPHLIQAQHIKFYYANSPKVVRGSDTLSIPFTGGFNSPQFANFDFNNDSIQDLFVFDRATSKVRCFVRTTNGYMHAPQYELAFPYMESFALSGDYNHDGKPDIFTTVVDDQRYVLDPTYKVYAPGLRILKNNTTAGIFSLKQINPQVRDTGRNAAGFNPPLPPMFNLPPRNVSTSSLDNMAIGDIDNDGDDDLITFEGIYLSPQYVENYKINPFNINYHPDSTRFIFRDMCWGDMQYAASSGRNKFNLGLGRNQLANCDYQLYGKQQKHAGSAMVMLDYTNDGFKDIVYGDVGYTNLLLLKNGRGINSKGRDSIVEQDTAFPSNTTPANFILFPAPYYVDINGDGKKELLVSTNNTFGVKNTDNVWVYNNTGTNANPVFEYEGNDFFLFNQSIDLGSRTVPLIADMNNDGKKDLLIATSGNFIETQNTKDRLLFYENLGSDTSPVYRIADSNFLNLSAQTNLLEMHPALGDLTGDGKPDLVIGNTNGKLFYYVNTSTTQTQYTLQAAEWNGIDVGNNAAPHLYDLDKDGDLDMLVGTKSGIIRYFENKGTRTNPIFDTLPNIDTLGGINTRYTYIGTDGYDRIDPDGYATPFICELDGDTNTIELLVGSSRGFIHLFTNISDSVGAVFNRIDTLFSVTATGKAIAQQFGVRSTPFVTNMDGDDKPDIIIGELGGGLHFYASVPSVNDTFNNVPSLTKSVNSINVFPNPASQTLSFLTIGMKEDVTYSVIDIVGRTLSTGNVNHYLASHQIDVSALPNGVYFLELSGSNAKWIAKFIVNH
ncbi:MAG: T9SS type A sorting domain-containing protein [Bacteroidia bacterium]|jgi:hypothetical protein|nr:T9SS type A sorting domain-containing protein [Bacteroidia bacterium]